MKKSFLISVLGLGALLTLGLAKGIDTSMAISGVVLAYVGSRSGLKGAGMLAASRDKDCSTMDAIDKLRG